MEGEFLRFRGRLERFCGLIGTSNYSAINKSVLVVAEPIISLFCGTRSSNQEE